MGWVRSNLDAVRRLRAKLQGSPFTVVDEDGNRTKVNEADFYENFQRNAERLRAGWRRKKIGSEEAVPPPHKVGAALTRATNPLPQLLENAAETQRRLDRQLGDLEEQ